MGMLLDVLTQYAKENLVSRFLLEAGPEFSELETQVEQLTQQLKALPEAEALTKKLTFHLDSASLCRNQAFLLSGISIGLSLGRL